MSVVSVKPQAMVARVMKLAGFEKPDAAGKSTGMLGNIWHAMREIKMVEDADRLDDAMGEHKWRPTDLVTVEVASDAEVAGAIRKCPHLRFEIAGELMIALQLQLKLPPPTVTEGFWWARDKRDGETTIIEVSTRDLEPDDEGYGDLFGTVMGRDYSEAVDDKQGWGLLRNYDFISKIQEPA